MSAVTRCTPPRAVGPVTAVTGITVDGDEMNIYGIYTAISTSYTFNRLLHLPQERLLENIGSQRGLMLDCFWYHNPITLQDVGEDRYVKTGMEG